MSDNEMSATTGKITEALVKAQAKIKPAAKKSENPYFHSKYADLGEVWNACREALGANGLAVVQTTAEAADGLAIVTTLLHTSGEWIRGRLPLKPVKNDPQGIGSAITYARRYALAAIVGVCSDEDDDGNASSLQRPPAPTPASETQKPMAERPEVQRVKEVFGPAEHPAELKTLRRTLHNVDAGKTKTGKPYWYADMDETRYSTFDSKLGDAMATLAGSEVNIVFTEKPNKNPKYPPYRSIVAISPVGAGDDAANDKANDKADLERKGQKEDTLPF